MVAIRTPNADSIDIRFLTHTLFAGPPILSFLLRTLGFRTSSTLTTCLLLSVSMASVSATSVRFGTSVKPASCANQATGRIPSLKLVFMGVPGRRSFASTRSSSLCICCAAKPETVEKVCEIVRKQLALPADSTLTPESKFSALGADSLDTVEIVMGLEEEFDISVEEESSQNITTIQEAADLIEKLVEKKTEAA